MSRKWIITFVALFVSGGLAVSAFLYHSPAELTLLMREVLLDVPVWNMHIQGTVGVLPIQGDVVKRENSQQLLRVSYAPLKRINNQWVVLDAPYASGGLDLFESIVLTKRLASVKEDTRQFARYSFVIAPSTLALFPDVTSGEGEVWFPKRPSSWIPDRVKLIMHTKSDSDVKMDLVLRYGDLFHASYPAPGNPRLLSDILAQLAQGPGSDVNKPPTLPTLTGGQISQAFSSDFDQDGLSDALEPFYGADPANPDSDNDTFLDGEEVKRGYNPMGEGSLN